MKIKSYAKINLGLYVQGKRADGYHNIRTAFQTIDLFDVIRFDLEAEDVIRLEGDDASIPWGEENLIFQAARLLKSYRSDRKGVAIHVNKRIPAGKGLGGGSSNAAVTLLALNALWMLDLDAAVLQDLGRRLGADVPYFLHGGLCLGSERGDVIRPLPELPERFGVLVLPEIFVSTASVYGKAGKFLTSKGKGSKMVKFLARRQFGLLENDLEETVFNLHPTLKETKMFLLRLGAELSLISGSGSAVFGIFPDKGKAEAAAERIKDRGRVRIFKTISRERYDIGYHVGV